MATIYDEFIGKKCVIRTDSAGVHCGTVERVEGTTVLPSCASAFAPVMSRIGT
ncbi:MAG: hypothetical protein LBT46_01875 [Planctomycetaceae bacterium]|jgi:hypothetical protein|nr:hypothetical protein [Planctomycetaceae bacterium]